jgi:hypothetical protein
MKKALIKTSLILSGIILALIVSECYLYFFQPQQIASTLEPAGTFNCWQKGTYYYSRVKPNANCILHSNLAQFPDFVVNTNSLGLRNKEITAKPPNTKRVLFLGDSFTFGWGVEEPDAYPRLVESYLSDYPIEVINAGRPSSSLGHHYLFLINEGLSLKPDLVVVGFDLLNSYINLSLNSSWDQIDENGLPTKISNKSVYVEDGRLKYYDPPLTITTPWLGNSHLFALVTNTFFPSKSPFFQTRSIDLNNQATLSQALILLTAMQKRVENQGGQFLVLLIPDSITVENSAGISQQLGKYFSFTLQRKQINTLDLLPALTLRSQNQSLYFSKDAHWNKLGHQAAAQAISSNISEMLKK